MNQKKHIIFGGKGFIGQNLARELVIRGDKILIVDKNQWTVGLAYSELLDEDNVQLTLGNINHDFDEISASIAGFLDTLDHITVWHLAANSDIGAGNDDIEVDLTDTFLTTLNVLKYCNDIKIQSFYFASSSAVYGDFSHDANGFKETDGTQPISNYGAMKLASEAILRAAHQQFLDRCIIFRFPNVIGYPATHGVIRDFIDKLQNTPDKLIVLGDGNQNKPYLHVSDLVSAMLHLDRYYVDTKLMETINIGSPYENVFVRQIAEEVRSIVSPNANIVYGDTPFGWVGDMPSVKFNIDKMLNTKWRCGLSGLDAVRRTINEILRGEVS